MRKYKKEGKNTMRDNLDIEQKEHLKIEDNKRKKRKQDDLTVNEKEQLRNYEKKRKEAMRDNLNNEKKEHIKIDDSKKKKNKKPKKKTKRKKAKCNNLDNNN